MTGEPIKFFVLRTIRKTYACRHCDPDTTVPAEQRIQTAGPTQVGPIAKGLCGPGLLAHAITAKFADHTPLHRLAGHQPADLDRSAGCSSLLSRVSCSFFATSTCFAGHVRRSGDPA